MARDRLLLTSGWIVVNVVATTVSEKGAAVLFKLADQLGAFHNAISLVL
jgi:hypothetical protein